MRMLAWCGTNAARSLALTPAAPSACFATLAISQTAQRNTTWPSWRSVGQAAPSTRASVSVRFMRRSRPSSHRSPRPRRRCPESRSADDDGARAVAEQERDGAVGGIDELRQFLRTDDERVVRRPRAHQRVGLGHGVAEPGTGRVLVVRGGGVRADSVCDDRGHRGRDLGVADGRDDHEVDVRRGNARLLDGLPARVGREGRSPKWRGMRACGSRFPCAGGSTRRSNRWGRSGRRSARSGRRARRHSCRCA